MSSTLPCVGCEKVLAEIGELKTYFSSRFEILFSHLTKLDAKLSSFCEIGRSNEEFEKSHDNDDLLSNNNTDDHFSRSLERRRNSVFCEDEIDVRNRNLEELHRNSESSTFAEDVDVKPNLEELKKSINRNEGNFLARETESATVDAINIEPLKNNLFRSKKQFIFVRTKGQNKLFKKKLSSETDGDMQKYILPTPLGVCIRKPVSEEYKRRLAISKPKLYANFAAQLLAKNDLNRADKRPNDGFYVNSKKPKLEIYDGATGALNAVPSQSSEDVSSLSDESRNNFTKHEERDLFSGLPNDVYKSRGSKVCVFCKRAFGQEGNLAKHLKSVHGKFYGKCRYCYKIMFDEGELYNHEIEHVEKSDKFQCRTCKKGYNRLHNLIRHMRMEHNK